MAVNLPAAEQEQILQTIEMFEVIVQANPDDYQSLDLLREAYGRLGRAGDARRISLQKAEACIRLGQLDAAYAAVRTVLDEDPSNGEAQILAADLEKLGYTPSDVMPDFALQSESIDLDFSTYASEDTSLTELQEGDQHTGKPLDFGQINLPETDGNDGLAEFLRDNDLAMPDVLDHALAAVRKANATFQPERVATPLLSEVFRHGTQEDEETVLLKILNQTKFGFVPLGTYDIDRQIVKLLPVEFTLGRLIVPFDLISRTLLIAMANPFDKDGCEACRSMLDYNIQWYFARPNEIVHTLTEAYRLSAPAH